MKINQINGKKILIYLIAIILICCVICKAYGSWSSVEYYASRTVIGLNSGFKCFITNGNWRWHDRGAGCDFPVTRENRLYPTPVMCGSRSGGFVCECPEGKIWGSIEEGCIVSPQDIPIIKADKTVDENSKQDANNNDAALKADDARITDRINNGEYYSSSAKSKIILRDGSFYIESDTAKTSFGIYFSVGKYATGDLNNDGNNDAAVILKSFNEGGSVPAYDLNILINQEEELVWRASKYFQYGTQIKSINIGNREIIIDTIIPGLNEMPCCPTVEKTFRYQLIDGDITESDNLGDNLCDKRDGIWKNYESKEIGVSFKHPADCVFMGDYSDWGRITWFNCKQFHISIGSKNHHPYIIDYANNQPISPDWTIKEFIANMEVEKSGYGQNEILFIKKLSSKSLLVAEYASVEGSSYLKLFVLSPLNKNYPNLKIDINYPFEEDKSVKEYVELAKLQGRDHSVPRELYDDVAQKILAGTYSEELGCLINNALQIADSSELINN
jgi:hypothetical protein